MTLTIDPGVQVRFVDISDDQSGGNDANRSELIVEGIVRAIGTVTDSIVFTSNAETPAAAEVQVVKVGGLVVKATTADSEGRNRSDSWSSVRPTAPG